MSTEEDKEILTSIQSLFAEFRASTKSSLDQALSAQTAGTVKDQVVENLFGGLTSLEDSVLARVRRELLDQA